MRIVLKFFRVIFWLLLLGIVLVAATIGGAILYFNPELPSVESLKDIRLEIPLRVYTSDNKLMAQFGEKRRTPVSYDEVPNLFIKAVYAAEDDSFETHHGIDIKSLTRAAIELVRSGKIKSGGSTITMQVARNYFLNKKQSFRRKSKEILLAVKIEMHFSKHEILELYFNRIFLGNRAYGIQAAAQVYYGKPIDELSLAQLAMIAGLPKNPSHCNPLSNPDCAKGRRNWILGRMLKLEYITQAQYDEAEAEPVTASYHGPTVELSAPYVAEMVRREMIERYGDQATTAGYRVYTTIDSKLQTIATQALRQNLLNYTRRHGYRGPETRTPENANLDESEWLNLLKNTPTVGNLEPAIVTQADEKHITALLKNGEYTTIEWEEIKWARAYIDADRRGKAPTKASDIVKLGDLIRVQFKAVKIEPEDNEGEENTQVASDSSETDTDENKILAEQKPESSLNEEQKDEEAAIKIVPSLAQIPEVQGAMVALNPNDGGIIVLVGGFDFEHSKFNRVTQAKRQPGSNLKPFLYTTALANGYTAASIINDAPINQYDASEERDWRPQNSGGDLKGPTRLREGLYFSRNLVSIRLLRELTIPKAIEFIGRFGFDADAMPNNLTLALGTGLVTPLDIVSGYAIFANGGYKVSPYIISRINDADDNIVFINNPAIACEACNNNQFEMKNGAQQVESSPVINSLLSSMNNRKTAERVIDEETAYIMDSILKDVIRKGTGRRALALKRNDIAGKTGTTNDQVDAWFSGYNSNIVTTAWVGFDEPKTLGKKEFGAVAALPMWIEFMKVALQDKPDTIKPLPETMVKVKIDPQTGLLASPDQPDAIEEVFTKDTVPTEQVTTFQNPYTTESETIQTPEQIF